MNEPFHLLTIEDSEDDRYLYRRLLTQGLKSAIHIEEKDNGEDGLRYLQENTPDCVLLDYSLPGQDGIEILQKIREDHPFLAIVMLTGQGNEALAVKAIRAGAQNYISKNNLSAETLKQAIGLAVDHSRMEKHIEEQRTSLELFTRALAHDLREPVRTIRSFLDILKKTNLSEEKTKEYYSYIYKAAERMAALIDSVYALLQADKSCPYESSLVQGDANIAFKNAKENLNALIEEKKATVTSDDLPLVAFNQNQLERILQNLISNAIQHTPGNVRVHVSAKQEQEKWTLSVTDNGPGISEEDQKRIFDPFKRLHNNSDDNLGLGLSICRKILETRGSHIFCHSTPPGGATFSFALPSPFQTSVPASAQTAFSMMGRQSPLATGLATLLLVEDNDADIELARLELFDEQNLHCDFLVSKSGADALDKLKQHLALSGKGIDLVLLDINMPGLDGFQTLSKIRTTPSFAHTPVVMCTTSSYENDKNYANALGANGYINKPLVFSQLKNVLTAIPSVLLSQEDSGYFLYKQKISAS
ncbi:MAG: response regulator [Bdellovibrionales bacterium]